jgi:hypothetical protein
MRKFITYGDSNGMCLQIRVESMREGRFEIELDIEGQVFTLQNTEQAEEVTTTIMEHAYQTWGE